MTNPICVIIDANAFVHKSFHGYDEKLDKMGQDNKVLYGLMQHMHEIQRHIPVINYMFAVFDPIDGSLFRKSIFPAYKENRLAPDVNLVKQKELAKKVLQDELGLPLVDFNGYEADDIIGTMATIFNKKNVDVIIVSPDKDLCQLVNSQTKILRPYRKSNEKGYEYVTENGVTEIFGVPPSLIPDYLALVGDTADNLPGVHKMGPKTASKYLAEYLSVEHIVAISGQLEGNVGENIRKACNFLPLVKFLATIKTDLPLELHIEESLNKAIEIQSHIGYKQKLFELQEYYYWKPWFINGFLN